MFSGGVGALVPPLQMLWSHIILLHDLADANAERVVFL